jgi:hypothetical protein
MLGVVVNLKGLPQYLRLPPRQFYLPSIVQLDPIRAWSIAKRDEARRRLVATVAGAEERIFWLMSGGAIVR